MLEKSLSGSKRYWLWVGFLLVVILGGFLAYLRQYNEGLGVTGMSRDVSWGLYISQFTFLVGVAASAVMVAIPYYLHNYKKFGKIVILGEFLAVPSVIMCILFIFVDVGRPDRILNVLLHPTPHSVMFWDMCVLCGYLLLNLVIGWTALGSERKGFPPPAWVKPLIYLSIPWAVSIHTVTAFLYSGMPGRHLWLTAIMAARFLASAFAAGPALLILLCMIVRKVSTFDPGKEAIQSLAKIVTYAMIANVFFYILEFFTAFYSNIPGHMHPLQYLFAGLHGHGQLVPFMWVAVVLAFVGIFLLVVPKFRRNEKILPFALLSVFIAAWIDKGLGLVLGGFVPTPLEHVVEYTPTATELAVTLMVYAIGALLITILYKVVIGVREEI
ncbi:putative sulfite reductase-associated electron transfer protein DsrP [Desulfitobacterium sp. LBE]|uniref:Membrane protein, DsmC-like n=4 Tax=root TaxID=1 RepID=A0A098AUU9_DESHA|nr:MULTISPECIES: NrfD/PsrC family molybdoenzyme membrane anchor subunit [Desulfitobacterium]ACL18328.1 Polysulphide reductase NrfD [Desulfitobacterium hafniense DCB-2]EHL08063.1 polysulfide reductase, NrfD [Desulfitobacterium hafniense DP7]MEA5025835.1 NrfD/PsrC family molybdoenzyme membrane anchor subunit [Desulfitobacterium hafniense]TWH58745.1 putative sulfite reductase-associated electron transfer protein DsrP [Desulfitobacterium sp. LBE]CDX00309.1 Membrane protein, DsmC-like [Desulfitobac